MTDGQCYASSFWTLGKGIGERVMHFKLIPGNGFEEMVPAGEALEAHAWTRATPRLVAGLAASKRRSYIGLRTAQTRVVKVEVVDTLGRTETYETLVVTRPASAETVRSDWIVNAVAALTVPIPLSPLGKYDVLTTTAGVDFASPANRFFLGISALQLLGVKNRVIESLPVDVHVMWMWERQEVLRDQACLPNDCRTVNRWSTGTPSFMITADATQVLTDLVNRILK